jgi:hypothetical protein
MPEDILKVRQHYLDDETVPEKVKTELNAYDFSEFAQINGVRDVDFGMISL